MSFFQRLLTYVANEVIVKKLANSHTFQRLALRLHLNVKAVQEKGKAALPDLNATNVTEKATEVTQRAAGFVNTFRENFKKEMEAVRRTEKQPSTKPKP